MRPASSNHIFCIARNTGQPHQKKHDLTMRAKIKTDTVYATLPVSPKKYNYHLSLPKIGPNEYVKPIISLEESNMLLSNMLQGSKPFMTTRLGSAELMVILNYKYLKEKKVRDWDLAKINQGLFRANAVFPQKKDTLKRFSELYLNCLKNTDVLAIWYNYGEQVLHKEQCPDAFLIPLESLEPFRFSDPWSKHLTNKKVLVVSPFADTIKFQYKRRQNLFENTSVLPEFDLIIYRPFNSYTDTPDNNKDWFYYLNKMLCDIEKINFDIAIIGAGPFGLPIASHIKKLGRKSIHIGGATQLLFGIKGSRWEQRPEFLEFMNVYWIKPLKHELPNGDTRKIVDNNSYW